MEKIYEEKGKKKQSFFQQLFNDKGSMVAVIVVAVVAVVGLIAFGFNQISFAADEIDGTGSLEEKYVSAYGRDTNLVGSGGYVSGGTEYTFENISFIPYQMQRSVGTAIYKDYVICIDYMTEFANGAEYFSDEPVYDNGLIHLMTELDNVLPTDKPELAYWLKQTAVWAYLYESESEADLAKDPSRAEDYKNIHDNVKWVNTLSISNESAGSVSELYKADPAPGKATFWNEYGIEQIYNDAVAKRNSSSSYNYDIELTRDNDKISLSENGKDYVTSSYYVTSKNSNLVDDYYIELDKNIPEGTKVYDANSGQVINIEEPVSGATKFKLVIPVDKVNDKNKNFKVSVYSDYIGEGLVEFINTSNGYQTVVDNGPIYLFDEANITVSVNYTPNVPNTGMTTAQTIYFIGLIILLGGVGIIYANAKPQENN